MITTTTTKVELLTVLVQHGRWSCCTYSKVKVGGHCQLGIIHIHNSTFPVQSCYTTNPTIARLIFSFGEGGLVVRVGE
jgi:hypothetical protein